MADDEDTALDERRLMGAARDQTVAYVGSSLGLTRVEIAGDQIGRFSLVLRDRVRSVAGGSGRLLVGTDEDVLVASGEAFVSTGFGPASAVSLADGTPIAVDQSGDVARLVGDNWVPVGSVVGPARMDGDLLVAGDGVYRIGAALTYLGGDAVRDVASAGPYMATADGVFRYDDGWHREGAGDCTLVAARAGRAHAVCDRELRHRDSGEWQTGPVPTETAIAGLAHGESLYAVTADGTVLVRATADVTPDGREGWRSRALGTPAVVGIAVP